MSGRGALSPTELAKYRFSYVRAKGEVRRSTGGHRQADGSWFTNWGDWKEFEAEGILTFGLSGDPRFNYNSNYGKREVKIYWIEEVFKPEKDAIRRICRACKESHSIGRILDMLRISPATIYAKGFRCDICGKASERTGRAGIDDGFIELPTLFYRARRSMSDQEIWELFSSKAFERQMKDWVMEPVLIKCEYRFRYCKEEERGYDLVFWIEGEDDAHAFAKEPPPSAWWQRRKSINELREHLDYMKIGDFLLFDNRKDGAS